MTIIPPVNIAPSAVVGNSTLGPYVYVGPDCEIDACRLENAIVLDHAKAQDSIFGSHVLVSNASLDANPGRYISD
ncbi:hypothetical protein GXP70_17595 [Paenibacillus lycopersici]|uniref:Acyl-[acyl-carrier-protein]--UDP-N-acetylglucosamine O-acyltransferase n=1 Tax=Paenibacillus lycopersici TaxID=2704462 RepID=A0A6C0G6S0_9BACL|nr:hypothetical protein [Paenibacillus lycopersici]QHT61605.1 hypothetical protein GXP70_17595 [Paenibacillus lycopersici]